MKIKERYRKMWSEVLIYLAYNVGGWGGGAEWEMAEC